MMDTVTTYGPVAVKKIVKKHGHPPSVIRNAIISMRRRGSGYKSSLQAVSIVNAAHAGENWQRERLTAFVDEQQILAQIELESTLAHAFIQWRKTVDPSKRATLWREIENAAERLEEMR